MSAATPSVSRVTTHVLDATSGRPAEGVAVELLAFDGVSWRSVDTAATDADGRVTRIGGDELPAGDYRLRFETGAWFAERGIETFYPEVVLTFTVADDGRHVHAPLLLSPFAYSTYRGELTMSEPGIVLGVNQYGKAEVRVVKVTRDTARHEIDDLNVTSQLRGDFAAAHLEGDNSHVVATDTQKNTIFAFARDGIGSPEAFLLRLADHFTSSFPSVTGGRWEAERYGWERIVAHGAEHDHAFVRSGQEVRTAVVVADGDERHVIAGLKDLTVLKTTASGFEGYPKDRYTTLPETRDRILATDVAARWRYGTVGIDYDALYASVRALLLEAFAERYSAALQATLFDMGRRVLEEHPEIAEIRFSMPNNHHFVVDLSPFGLDNPNEVFFAADRPYGLIEASVEREGVPSPAAAWAGIAGFC